jgi:hypothetical protein
MNDKFHDLEACLAKLQPTCTDEDFLNRLEAAVDGSLVNLSVEEIRFERMLAANKPAALSADLLRSLEGVVASTPFAVDEKIVLFTQAGGAPVRGGKRTYRPMAAAAAVAILGGLTALFLPVGKGPGAEAQFASSVPVVEPSYTVNPSLNFSPASFQRNVQNATDQGVVWKGDRPHRLMRFIYSERKVYTDPSGKQMEIEIPRVEFHLVPERMD